GNLLSKTTREALQIINNKSKVHYSRNKSNISRMNTTSRDNASKSDDIIDKLADQILTLVDIFAKKIVTPALVKAVEESCVTYGGNHAYYNCPNTNGNQPSVCVAAGTYNQVAPQNRASNYMAPLGFASVKSTIVTLHRVVKQRMTIETYNWSSSAHQELHKIEATKIVGDFKSLANEADASLAKHKAFEMEIERLLKAVVSQDIIIIVQNESVVDTSDLQTELEHTRNPLSQKLENEDVELEFQLFKKVSDQKNKTLVTSENTKFAKQPIVVNLPKIGKTNALSKPVTSNSVSTPQESKSVNNDKVIAPGMFRINPSKTSREEKHVPNTPRSNTKHDTVPFASKSSRSKNKEAKVEEHHRNLLLSKNNKHISSACNNIQIDSQDVISKVVCVTCSKCLISVNHDKCLRNYVNGKNSRGKKQKAKVIQICLWCVDSGCFKHMTGNLKLLINFVWKFMGTVRFKNDHVEAILGFGDLQWGNVLITRVYFVEGLGHNLFSVGQFCDSDLEFKTRTSKYASGHISSGLNLTYAPSTITTQEPSEGVASLSQWCERMESVFHISNCTAENQVKFATCTLHSVALTWWNTHVQAVGHEELKVKGTDLASYTQRFQELALLCGRMFSEEADKIEKYVGGLPDMIHGSVVASKPKTMQDAIKIATELMDKKVRTFTERETASKRKLENTSRTTRNLQQQQQHSNKRQNTGRVYTAASGEKKQYGGSKPLCAKCNYHHDGPCAPKCHNYNKSGHFARDCRATTNTNNANNQRGTELGQKPTCYECGVKGHYKRECPRPRR
nr:hypothetical protein [Tanacetum cinerariifolium]